MGEGVLHQNDLVPIGGLHAGDAASATVLGSEGIVVHAFDIPVAGQGNDDILLRDEVFVFDVGSRIRDFG